MPNRTDPFNYHFRTTSRRSKRDDAPSSSPPSPRSESPLGDYYLDENCQPMKMATIRDADDMLSAASTGDMGGGYYYTSSTPAPPPPLPTSPPFSNLASSPRASSPASPPNSPRAADRRSKPLWTNPRDFTRLPRHQARLQAMDFRASRSDSRTPMVNETEIESDDEDDEDECDERLIPRRMGPSLHRCERDDENFDSHRHDAGAAWFSALAMDSQGASCGTVRSRVVEAANGSFSEQREPQQEQGQEKRKFSVRFSEAITDISKVIKKRTDSFTWRKDSGASLQDSSPSVRGKSNLKGNSTARLTVSKDRTQEGGNELNSRNVDESPSWSQLRQASRQFDALRPPQVGESAVSRPVRPSFCESARRGFTQVAPLNTAVEQLERFRQHHRPQRYPGPVYHPSETPQHAMARDEYELIEHFHESGPTQRLVIMERQVRIAERQGAFKDAKRKKMFRKTYAHRCTLLARARASRKLKMKVAMEQEEADKLFSKWGDMSPKRVWGRFRRWSRGEVGIAEPRGRYSALESVAEESGYVSDES